VLPLAFVEGPFDAFVSLGLLHLLHPNDVRIVVRQAARLAPKLLLSVRTAASSAPPEPAGTLRSAEWWLALCARYFDVVAEPGVTPDDIVIRATRRSVRSASAPSRRPKSSSTMTPFHIRPGYTSRQSPDYFPDLDEGVVWQPDVYRLLADLAGAMDCRRVIDLGCGRARKLVALHPAFEIVGVDMGPNLEHCREQFAFGNWVEADFELPTSLPAAAGASASSAVVCSDVIEHLVDPTALMAALRALLETAPFAIVTTPERDLTHGPGHDGPPPNPSHVREWNAPELASYAAACALDVAFVGLTASHSLSFDPQTTLLLLAGRSVSPVRRERLITTCQTLLDDYARARLTSTTPLRAER
jgi:2-polyprenyl-3-methyl-5-hydroxy-6-metoxy-1,4-benzoquinol methylase